MQVMLEALVEMVVGETLPGHPHQMERVAEAVAAAGGMGTTAH
jgi:hypothetical protein